MDELSAQVRARQFVAEVGASKIPVSVDDYVSHLGGCVRVENDMKPDEAGMSFVSKGRLYICVNGKDSIERQRFTICHEIAHQVLGISTEHQGVQSWNYAKRTPNEIICDVFAAELLLPWQIFKPHADHATPGFRALDELADQFLASVMCTGSRFATVVGFPCAFVLAQHGRVRYSSRSTSLRATGAWIQPRSQVSTGCLTARVSQDAGSAGPQEVDPDVWFSDWSSGGTLYEEARLVKKWDQTLTLLWGEEDGIQAPRRPQQPDRQDDEYRELDGVLPWPGRRRQKK